jgi:hypothetical protein
MMIAIGNWEKYAAEKVLAGRFAVDFGPDLVAGETLVSAVITVLDETGVDVTATLTEGGAVTSGTVATQIFVGGTAGEVYDVGMVATSTLGGIYEEHVTLSVI